MKHSVDTPTQTLLRPQPTCRLHLLRALSAAKPCKGAPGNLLVDLRYENKKTLASRLDPQRRRSRTLCNREKVEKIEKIISIFHLLYLFCFLFLGCGPRFRTNARKSGTVAPILTVKLAGGYGPGKTASTTGHAFVCLPLVIKKKSVKDIRPEGDEKWQIRCQEKEAGKID